MSSGVTALEADRARVAEIEAQFSDSDEETPSEGYKIQDQLDAYKYPVLTLPTEITSEIFVCFLPPYPLCPPMTGSSSPTLLTHICRTWRNIALATPTLWRAVQVIVEPETVETQKDHIKSRLIRSGSCPLSIQMVNCAALLPEDQLEVIQALIRHRARWEYLELSFIATNLLSFFSEATPLLHHLEISLEDPPSPSIRFDRLPLMRSAFLGHSALTDVSLPWQQLTSLTLNAAYPHECTPILQQAPSLLYCRIVLLGGSDGEEPDMFLPCLETLVLGEYSLVDFVDGDELAGYLDTFITPALRSLEVLEVCLGSDPVPSLASFISNSGCKLQELQIIGRERLSEDSYRNAFPSIPKISFV
ncbi:hypothetical protein C8R43DRAFT_1236854 [Mycena crocata]|nr:hypothetical protein C8R43DRAFT_1236854 [Mycena crocata]